MILVSFFQIVKTGDDEPACERVPVGEGSQLDRTPFFMEAKKPWPVKKKENIPAIYSTAAVIRPIKSGGPYCTSVPRCH
jgi:hypothetical protein